MEVQVPPLSPLGQEVLDEGPESPAHSEWGCTAPAGMGVQFGSALGNMAFLGKPGGNIGQCCVCQALINAPALGCT